MKFNIRLLYLYLFSFIGLLVTVFGCINMVNLGLKTFVFKNADRYVAYPRPAVTEVTPDAKPADMPSVEEEKLFQEQQTLQQRQREAAQAIAMIAVGLPLYAYHWMLIKRQEK